MIDDRSKIGRFVGLFLLGNVLFSYPILTLFNLEIQVAGIPLFYLFLFIAWSGFILFIFFITKIRPFTLPGKPSSTTINEQAEQKIVETI